MTSVASIWSSRPPKYGSQLLWPRLRFRLPKLPNSHFIIWIAVVCSCLTTSENPGANYHQNYFFFPSCINRPDRYTCECGPGFSWNTKMCVADGLDSYFEFSSDVSLHYSILVNKPFPVLVSFTASFWIRVQRADHPGVILSYTDLHGTELLQFRSGPTLQLRLYNESVVSNVRLNVSEWTHVVWTWSSLDGAWSLVVNGGVWHARGVFPGTRNRSIPSGGRLLLGQTSKAIHQDPRTRDSCCSFIGQMGFVNIWRRVLRSTEVQTVFTDCTRMQCGDAVQWADFRSGTRGTMRFRWPSRIYDTSKCYSESNVSVTCDQYCSQVKGARCKEEILNNIRWERTPTDSHVMMPCPGSQTLLSNSTKFVHRRCLRTAQNESLWFDPVLDYCVSSEEIHLKQQVERLLTDSPLNDHQIGHLLRLLRNRMSGHQYNNILDVATVIDMLRIIIRAQLLTIERLTTSSSIYKYGLNRRHDKTFYPTWKDTDSFSKMVTDIVNHLLDEKNGEAWEYSLPPGAEGDRLFQVIEELLDLLAVSVQFHVSRGDVEEPEQAFIHQQFSHIKYSVKMERRELIDELTFEDGIFGRHTNPSSAVTLRASLQSLNRDDINHANHSHTHFETLSMGEYRASRLFNRITGKNNKDDCLNSPILSFKIHPPHGSFDLGVQSENPVHLIVSFSYIESFNVSNPDCVHLIHGNRTSPWSWTTDSCHLVHATNLHVTCHCSSSGFFALLSDLYDVNWTSEEEQLTFVTLPSYIGCFFSILLCFLSFVLHFYFRTASKTASLHKNFALAIIGGKLVFVFGTEQVKNETLCHVMAAALHYFFLATFCWLMNEAFNLYIVITYAAHARGGEQSDGGSLLRFHVLGWILPGILVGSFIGAYTSEYFSTTMCWLDWKYIWIMLGPVIGIILVTMLVLVFTAKEQSESAYSKNERTNKTIAVYTKALWTQTILLSVTWFFIVLSVKMAGDIVKWLFALFDILQGAFFFVFFFLLNDEIVTAYKAALKRRDLNQSDVCDSPVESNQDLVAPSEEFIEMVPNPGATRLGAIKDSQTEEQEKTRLLTWKNDLPRRMSNENDDNDDDNDDDGRFLRHPKFTTTEV